MASQRYTRGFNGDKCNEGIKILTCGLLTEWTEARSNTFKLTIEARQAELTLNSSIGRAV